MMEDKIMLFLILLEGSLMFIGFVLGYMVGRMNKILGSVSDEPGQ